MQTTDTYQQERFGEGVSNSSPGSATSTGRQTKSVSRLTAAKALFLVAAGGSFLFSVYLWFLVDREQGLFVGLWVPSILALGALLLSGKGGQQ